MKNILKISRIVRLSLLVTALIYLVCALCFGYMDEVQTVPTKLYIWALQLMVGFEIATAITIAVTTKKPEKPASIGKVVQLKSGGPLMTVDEEDERTGFWYCIWFDNSQQRTGYFDPATLAQRY
jgi:uncharacterized protein YodC (DUF2158 family)